MIRQKMSTVIEETKSFDVNFIADVHLIQVLGEQLIGSEKVGLLELIKNAYDAGASKCDVWIESVPGLPDAELSDSQIVGMVGPVITIIDNGSGMNEASIRDGWLRPATRIKTSIKEQLKRERKEADRRGTRGEYEQLVKTLKDARGGRLPLGEKGVGRFATHRLGRYLILQTKVADESYEWVIEIDWDDFKAPDNNPYNLQDVPLKLLRRKPQRDYGPTESGTMLRIYGGREGFGWSPETLRQIGHAIALLRSPDKTKRQEGFDVRFHCPQLSSEKFEVPTDTVPAPFECTAVVDEKGKAEIEIRFTAPKSLSKPIPDQTWTELLDLRIPPENDKKYWQTETGDPPLRLPACGPFSASIKFWFRTKEWIEYPDWKEFTDYLDEFGGLGIFRDGLSILPAQAASKGDWLRLSGRHIEKGSRISYYQMWGSIDLLQEYTLGLIDRTSREGMLETQPFSDLRELVRSIVFALEFRVKEVRDSYNRMKRGERISESVLNSRVRAASQILGTVSSSYDFGTDQLGLSKIIGAPENPSKVVAEIAATFDELRREMGDLKAQSNALLEAAGYGIAISVSVHEIEKITSNLYFGLERLSKKKTPLDQDTHGQIGQLGQTAQALLNELKRIAPLRVTRLEPRGKFNVRDSILAATGAFQLAWEGFNIQFFGPPKASDFETTGSFGACSQVFANLFDNATYWLKASVPDGRRIIIQMDPVERKVVVADSGPGIADKMRSHLFELFYSLKNPPSGLGLYICRYYMRQMNGAIRESSDSERLPGIPGAHFTLVFPREVKGE